MFQHLSNFLRLSVVLTPETPLLIRRQEPPLDPFLPDTTFVRTPLGSRKGGVPYVPGSSFKGVLRSSVEKGMRSAGFNVCDPFSHQFCGKTFEKKLSSYDDVYERSCKACQIFGNTHLRSRLRISDFLPEGEVQTDTHVSVALNRSTQSVSERALFECEVVVEGKFRGDIVLENYTIEQLRWVLDGLLWIDSGFVPLGGGSSYGFGHARISLTEIFEKEVAPLPNDRSRWRGVRAIQKGETEDETNVGDLDLINEEDLATHVVRRYKPVDLSRLVEILQVKS